MSNIVIVESPAKAKTIEKYLGPDYKVMASIGHVRDLLPKNGSVNTDEQYKMTWEISPQGRKVMKEISDAIQTGDNLYLATDPDREGEAISWHVEEVLKEKKKLENVNVKRITFNEITKEAVNNAINKPRELDSDLINAYLARRALDYLVGFNLSPILWRKLPGSKSAGRVQSVALRIICERENEIEHFKPEEYWSIDVLLKSKDNQIFKSTLKQINDKKLKKLDIGSEAITKEYVDLINSKTYKVDELKSKEVKRNPYAPFITSTLQQDAGNKFGYSAASTMGKAQKLYQGGFITYMRTDSITLSSDAISQSREYIKNNFGDNYLPNEPRIYKSKAKNAQEAHEAIRPTKINNSPEKIKNEIGPDEFKLYKLIWNRTVASQMTSAIFKQITLTIKSNDNSVLLQSTGSSPIFDGMLKVYNYEKKSNVKEDETNIIPNINPGDDVEIDKIIDEQHFTQPPPRYTEASLVKKLEELGIGRPSTYASIISVISTRGYAETINKRFHPTDRGKLISAFLEKLFSKYVDYNFTAGLENQLDDITAGKEGWIKVLEMFWKDFNQNVLDVKEKRTREVLDLLNDSLGSLIFDRDKDGNIDRKCQLCKNGSLSLKNSFRGGAFIGCSNYPECKFTRPLSKAKAAQQAQLAEPKLVGKHENGNDMYLKNGRFGPYIQYEINNEIQDSEKVKKKKKKKENNNLKNISIPKGISVESIDIDKAKFLCTLPKSLGNNPDNQKEIFLNSGRFGPYLKCENKSARIENVEEIFSIGLNRAITLIAEAKPGRMSSSIINDLGEHPEDKKPVRVMKGQYGPYIKYKSLNATIPEEKDPLELNMEDALILIEKRKEYDKTKKKKKKK